MIYHITSREKQVLYLIANELRSQEIADELYISLYTVETHRRNLLKKLEVKNVAGLVRKGFEIGILELRQPRYQ